MKSARAPHLYEKRPGALPSPRRRATAMMDPYTTAQWQAVLLRERELQVAYSEYAFLAMCGGVRDEDLRRLRAAVVPTPLVVVKIEDAPLSDGSGGYTPLKQMIRVLKARL